MDHTPEGFCVDCGKPLPKDARSNQKRCKICKRKKDREYSKISKRRSRNKKKVSNILQKVFEEADFIKYFIRIVQGVMGQTSYHINFYKKNKTSQGTMLAFPEDLSPHAVDSIKTFVGQALSPQIQRDITESLRRQEIRNKEKEIKNANLEVFYSSQIEKPDFEPTLRELKVELKDLQKKLEWQRCNTLALTQQKDRISKQIDKLESRIKQNKKASS